MGQECIMQNLKFKTTVTYFQKGQIQEIVKEVSTSSSALAWKASLDMLPVSMLTQSKIKVQPVKAAR
jgi:hypothetical protein